MPTVINIKHLFKVNSIVEVVSKNLKLNSRDSGKLGELIGIYLDGNKNITIPPELEEPFQQVKKQLIKNHIIFSSKKDFKIKGFNSNLFNKLFKASNITKEEKFRTGTGNRSSNINNSKSKLHDNIVNVLRMEIAMLAYLNLNYDTKATMINRYQSKDNILEEIKTWVPNSSNFEGYVYYRAFSKIKELCDKFKLLNY